MHDYRIFWCALACALAGCATAQQPAAHKDDSEMMRTQLAELRALVVNQSTRLDSIDTRINSLSDKVAANQTSLENMMANHKITGAPVLSHPSEGAGTEPDDTKSADDPEGGFVTDGAIQAYRKAQILLEAGKYPEAILAFSSFVETYPDHPLAGSAQYGIGRAYLKEKEFKLAAREFERVLTSYDRSPHVSDTLKDLADTEEALKMPEQAARHRQLLNSLFAQSPAAESLASSAGGTTSNATTGAAAPHAGPTPQSGSLPAPTAPQPRLDQPPPSNPAAAPTTASTLPTAPMSVPHDGEGR